VSATKNVTPGISLPGVVVELLSRCFADFIFVMGLSAGSGAAMGYIEAGISPVRFRFVF
jgi:hypothetical protein